MLLHNGLNEKLTLAIALVIMLLLTEKGAAQKPVLDSVFSFSAGMHTTGEALGIISRASGYNFSYDSRLIDSQKTVSVDFEALPLRNILDRILNNDSLNYSIIDRYIIISARPLKKAGSDKITEDIIRSLTGRVIDSETREVLPFATIAVKNTGKGTVSNQNGEFTLKNISLYSTDTLVFSYLGYIRKEIPVRDGSIREPNIEMQREFIPIQEIIIKNQFPQELIQKARLAIAQNYGNTPAILTAFYREGVMRKNELQTYSEAVLKIFKSSYTGSLLGDQIKIVKSRKIENTDLNDTLALRLKAGLSTCLELDGVRNLFDFLSSSANNDYYYRLTDIVTYNDEAAYAIEFEQRDHVQEPLFKGTLYINTTDYGILNAEFEINRTLIRKLKDSFVTSSSGGFSTWPVSVKYSVSYRKIDKRYFLSHVRGDLLFSSDRKKIFFSSQFRVFFELAVTEASTERADRFDREDLAPVHSVFSRTIKTYDPLFWGDLDFLRPEADLLRELKNMNVRLREFSQP